MPSWKAVLVLWMVGGLVVAWLFSLVARGSREMDETAEPEMWERELAEFTARVRRPQ